MTELSLSTMVSEVGISDVKRLMRQEVELAKAEIRTEAARATSAGKLIAAGALAMHLVAVLVSAGAALAAVPVLVAQVPAVADYAPAIAAGGVALVWLIIGAIMLATGRRRLRKFSPIPRQTIQSLKEDLAWLRKPTG